MLIDAGPHRHQEQDPPSSVSVALLPHPLPLSPLLTPLGYPLFQLILTSHSGWQLFEGINLVLAITRFPDPAGEFKRYLLMGHPATLCLFYGGRS